MRPGDDGEAADSDEEELLETILARFNSGGEVDRGDSSDDDASGDEEALPRRRRDLARARLCRGEHVRGTVFCLSKKEKAQNLWRYEQCACFV